jgi:hypothetical protein
MSAAQSLPLLARFRTPERVRARWAWYAGRGILYALAALGAIVFMGPFLFALSGSLKSAV